jgi:hypothetical protein
MGGRGGPSRDFFEGGRAYTSFRRALRCGDDLVAMAIYHLHVKVIGRKTGSSAVASAAYRSASRLRDDRLERSHDFSAKRGVVHSEVLLPDHALMLQERHRLPKIRPTPTPSRTSERISARFVAAGVGADLICGLACISERPAVREPTTPGTENRRHRLPQFLRCHIDPHHWPSGYGC